MNKLHYLIILFIVFLGMASCSENDGTVDEYPDWQARNTTYFELYYDSAANGLNGWQRIKAISKDPNTEGAHTDYILAKVLPPSQRTESLRKAGLMDTINYPYNNDTAYVHYRGWLMPSTTYTDTLNWKTGLQFDTSWGGDYDEYSMMPYKASVGSFVTGFSTALQHMHVGDRWLIIIPYQLAYGSDESNSSIPAYSVLKFDLTLHSFSRAGHAIPSFQ